MDIVERLRLKKAVLEVDEIDVYIGTSSAGANVPPICLTFVCRNHSRKNQTEAKKR